MGKQAEAVPKAEEPDAEKLDGGSGASFGKPMGGFEKEKDEVDKKQIPESGDADKLTSGVKKDETEGGKGDMQKQESGDDDDDAKPMSGRMRGRKKDEGKDDTITQESGDDDDDDDDDDHGHDGDIDEAMLDE